MRLFGLIIKSKKEMEKSARETVDQMVQQKLKEFQRQNQLCFQAGVIEERNRQYIMKFQIPTTLVQKEAEYILAVKELKEGEL